MNNTFILPKHPIDSPEGRKAQKDFQTQFEYNGADLEAYNSCPLEKEAMTAERMITLFYKGYLNY